MEGDLRGRLSVRLARVPPEIGDAALYLAAALFALCTIVVSSLSTYRVWGEASIGVYVLAVAASVALVRFRRPPGRAEAPPADDAGARRRLPAQLATSATAWVRAQWTGRWRPARVWVFVFAFAGATLLPLGIEVEQRSHGNPAAHVQTEVPVIDQAGQRLARGQDPYHATVVHGHVESQVQGEPAYESFFPYLPLMAVYGLPSMAKASVQETDTQVFFIVSTLLVVALAMILCDAPTERKVRTLQVLTVLPTAALPLATGGDDIPVVAFLLLAMVLAQRRQPLGSGIVLGVVSAMKYTAWPLTLLALFAARDRNGKRAPQWMALGVAAVAGPAVVPFIVRNPTAFFDNTILYPLGLAGVASPAASALPGHLIVDAFPWLHRILPLSVAAIGLVILVPYLRRHPPTTAAQVTRIAGWVMLIGILFAPATRFGYLLYPTNFFVWSYMLRGADARAAPALPTLHASSVPAVGLPADPLPAT